MDIQLIKVAKELNVGMGTIVEFLSDKGFSIDNKPNARVNEEMHSALLKKFSDSKAEKEKADQLSFGNTNNNRSNAPTTNAYNRPRPVMDLRPPTNVNLSPEPVVEKLVPEFIERQTITLQQLKVVGKIDLDALNKPVPAKEIPKEIKPEITLTNRDLQKPRPSIQKVEPKPATPKLNTEEAIVKAEAPTATTAPTASSEIINGVETTNTAEGNDFHKMDAPQLQGLKIKGKIDVGRFNERPPSQDTRNNNYRGNNGGNNSSNNRNGQPQNRTSDPNRTGDPNRTSDPNRPRDPNRPSDPNRPPQNRPQDPNRPRDPNRPQDPNRSQDPNRPRDPNRPSDPNRQPQNRTNDPNRPRDPNRPQDPNRPRDPNRPSDPNRQPQNRTNDPNRPQTGGGVNNPSNPTPPPNTNNPSTSNADRLKRKRLPSDIRPPQTGTGTSNNNNNNNGSNNRPYDNRSNFNSNNRGPSTGGSNRPPLKPEVPQEISQQQIEAKIKETMARLNIGGKNKGQKIRRDKRERMREKEEQRQQDSTSNKLQVTEFISVSELASLLDIPATKIITTCMGLGIYVSINQRLDAELIDVIAGEYDREVEFISAEEQIGSDIVEPPDDPENLLPRAPIVTVMGHVDHGKTSLLDYIRKATVASGEAGGITQHIGAYEVKLKDERKVTFLDTPGHEAFTAMRARGAKVTDVAVIIIAADDNIMPQTKEAISHAQAAALPIVFAINKIDKPGADPERIKNELAQMNLLVEEWGGKYQSQDISAKTGAGIEQLLEKILLEADILELKANPNRRASGTVIEASLDKGRGYVTKMLVQNGTLNQGDVIIAGEYSGKIKAMFNERGKKVQHSLPASPILVLGLGGAPQAGETFKVMENESEAREIAKKRAQIVREQSVRATKRVSLDEIGRRLALGTFKTLNLIVKGDVDGSVEALVDSLLKLSLETVQVAVIHKAVGQITETDVLLASASDAIIIGFQVRPSLNARKLAEREGVEIKTYSIIYEAINELKSAIEGMLEPTKEESILGQVEIRQVYKISKIGTIAGCYVTEGKITRNALIRVVRDGIVVFPVKENQVGRLGSLKRFKDDQKEVKAGFECGLTIDGYNDIQEYDTLEAYEIIEVKQKIK